MGFLKSKPDYVDLDPNFKPGPKNGHLSEGAEAYTSVFQPFEDGMQGLWNSDISMADLKNVFKTAPPAIPENCPKPGKDVFISYIKAPVRDGTWVELKIWKCKKPSPNALLVFRMHGGGWTVGSHETEEAENLYLGALPNVIVVSVDYRMAPEFPFPYALNDSFDALRWCKDNAGRLGINSEKIVVAGCSAGGNLAAILSIKARNEGLSGIVGQILSIPVTCHPKYFGSVPKKERYELLSYVQNAKAPLVDTPRMEFFWDCYVGKNPGPDEFHSPLLCTNLHGLPPAAVHVAGLDPLRDEGIAYAEALKAAGVPTDLYTYKGLPHGFYSGVTLKETAAYFDRVIGFVKKFATRDSKL